jgi:MFS family permease
MTGVVENTSSAPVMNELSIEDANPNSVRAWLPDFPPKHEMTCSQHSPLYYLTNSLLICRNTWNETFQCRILWAAGLCFCSRFHAIFLRSLLLDSRVVLRQEWQLTEMQTSTINLSVFAGILLGSLALGPHGDSIERRPVFTHAASIFSFFWLLTAGSSKFLCFSTRDFLLDLVQVDSQSRLVCIRSITRMYGDVSCTCMLSTTCLWYWITHVTFAPFFLFTRKDTL